MIICDNHIKHVTETFRYNIFSVDPSRADAFLRMIFDNGGKVRDYDLLVGVGCPTYTYRVNKFIKWQDIKKLRMKKLKNLKNYKK